MAANITRATNDKNIFHFETAQMNSVVYKDTRIRRFNRLNNNCQRFRQVRCLNKDVDPSRCDVLSFQGRDTARNGGHLLVEVRRQKVGPFDLVQGQQQEGEV